ncbi:MAG: FtsQ-type POTRA domain-containing protein [Betaproteobacteria bacterium]|nr:FtsQ-type POTRA domain-containing protein [Betaproteobacteria bacterium]NBT80709.1 FtsQ-type POTRA domain-containing protein [Betaproteobacteria bacterium]NDE45775.1 FtsQ-type POTRA domain-containing protein [Betaproteobacteria bacterium]NDE93318.1 FtsQ-type POTRA domain-containing protein [Betaproteobacteria bacterium]NDG81318.1 FtsQ-type POTRA domain-containing protein [Betaproteobacteria bacterium]
MSAVPQQHARRLGSQAAGAVYAFGAHFIALRAGLMGLLKRLWQDPRWMNRAGIALACVAASALIWGFAHWMAQKPFFAMQKVMVEAAPGHALRHVSDDAIHLALRRLGFFDFFSLDLEGIRDQVEQVDWVRKAQVRRVWPNALVVEVEEHQPMAIWNGDRLINHHGELFTANFAEAEIAGHLPQLIGPDGSHPQVLARWRDLRQWLAPLSRSPSVLSLSASHAWQAKLDDGSLLLLGRDEGLGMEHRVARWVESHRSVIERLMKPVAAVDLRYPNGFALQLAEQQTGQGGLKKSAKRDR